MHAELYREPKQKIVSARSELTFDKGKREYVILVKLDDGKDRFAYYAANGFSQQYRFDSGSNASECASWLVGREYTGPQ